MCRERKTAEAGRPLEGKVEPEAAERGRAGLLEQVLSIDNVFDACGRAARNGGVDGMTAGGTATAPY